MLTFILGLVILVVGAALYGKKQTNSAPAK